MQQKRWKQIETILDNALTLSGSERTTYISTACEGDDRLIEEVYEMLRAIEESEQTHFLESVSSDNKQLFQDLPRLSQDEDIIGSRVGVFQITEKIGAGGMGAVYKASRADGQFSQEVAIKMLQKGIRAEDTIRRFRMEQEILASLKHPNIAQLYDGGITDDGNPYLVMEYIDGLPIDKYCNLHKKTVEERIELFKKVCSAVQFAHANLVIHRDLKAQNIYVTGDGQVKVLDFGIAKLLDPNLTEQTLVETLPGQKLWTPQYAAPEQVKGDNITIAADVYALGVLFHKLLTDNYPLDLTDKSLLEVQKIILDISPQAPSSSSQISERTAELRQTTLSSLKKTLAGDLDALILKSVRKEPEYRYASVNQLIEELDRFTKGLPLLARKDTVSYRIGKFYRRNKMGIRAGSLVVLLFISASMYYTFRITQEKETAETEAKKAQEITEYLKDIFQSSNPDQAQGETITAKQLLMNGADKISNITEQPEIKAELLEILADINYSLSFYDEADHLFKQALLVKRNIYGEHHPSTANTLYQMALNKENMGQYDTTGVLLNESLEIRKNILGENHIETIKASNSLSYLYKLQGNLDEAETLIEDGLKKLQDSAKIDSFELAEAFYLKASILTDKGEYEKALATQQKALDLTNLIYSPPHPDILKNLSNLARNHQKLGQYAQAESFLLESLAMGNELYDEAHLSTAVTINNLAGVYKQTGELAKADSMYLQALETLKYVLGNDHPYVASSLYNYAGLKREMGNYQEAEELYLETIRLDTNLLGPEHPNIALDYDGLGRTQIESGKYREAYNSLTHALSILERAYNNLDHPNILSTKVALATLQENLNELEEAEKLLKEVLAAKVKTYGQTHPETAETIEQLSAVLNKRGAFQQADSLMNLVSSQQVIE